MRWGKDIGGVAVLVAAFGFGLCACGAEDAPSPLRPASVRITNRSQYVLLELRIHEQDNYAGAENLLKVPLGIEESVIYYGSGTRYFTVYRERYELGPVYAFTTQSPVSVASGRGYILSVFDESFRLLDEPWLDPAETPWPVLNPP